MEELEDLLFKCGVEKKEKADNDFQAIEDYIGFPLPLDYKYYLNNYESFEDHIGKHYVVFYKYDDLLMFNDDIELEEVHSNTITIGSNGGSETIGIRFLDPDNYKVVIAQYIQDIEDHIEIGNSFTNMLQRLIDGKKWFS